MAEAAARKYTFVTVFYEDEYDFLLLQARSIRTYGDAELIGKILVIDNSERPLPRGWKARLLSEYGTLSGLVEIIGARDLAKLPWSKGWRTQQILKLMSAHRVATERYVILNSKNHLVFPLKREALEADDGRPRTHLYSYLNHPLRRYLERTLDYYGLERAQHVAQFAATATPFIMYTEIVRNLIADLSEREGCRFERAFMKRRLTEFFAYACFLIKSRGGLAALYDFHQASSPCIWEYAATRNGCDEVISKTLKHQSPFFSIHLLAVAKLDDDARKVVAAFWSARSLFETTEAADAFLAEIKSKCRKGAWTRPIWRMLKVLDSRRRSNGSGPLPVRPV